MTAIRAAQLQHSLLAIERIAGGEHPQVFARMRPTVLQAIREASRIDWLPLEFDLELSAAVMAVLGEDRDRERARQSVLLSMDSPLLGPILLGVQKLFELRPESLIRQVPRAFLAAYRDAGRFDAPISPSADQVLVYSDIPGQILDQVGYLDSLAGAFEAIYVPCGVEGRVSVEAVDPAQRRAELRFSWY